MKSLLKLCALLLTLLSVESTLAQGLIQENRSNNDASTPTSCGSYEYMEHLDEKSEGFLEHSDNFVLNLKKVIKTKQAEKSNNNIYRIPVVFHVVYNNEEENLADSVIQNQLDIMNDCFRRTNADAMDTRAEFLPYVGDAKIEFFLAETNPDGMTTDGITRTDSDIAFFGGVLPYTSLQTAEIGQWVTDSLFPNMFRITREDQGGIDPWDPERYLNIWIGDLRIFEPGIGNFEELVYFGLAIPPLDHYNWPEEVTGPLIEFNQGIIMHYVSIAENNPNSYPAPYQALNSSVSSGKMLVHETGHYLGLRHIWGDGNCSQDDFIDDTPLASTSGLYDCNFSSNTCTDDIDGLDLPNMVENYMDYTSGTCQNSFTLGQIDIMREVLEVYKPELAEVILTTEELSGALFISELVLYPNPVNEVLTISTTVNKTTQAQLKIHDSMGRLVLDPTQATLNYGKNTVSIDVSNLDHGLYYFSITSHQEKISKALVKN